jgi:predicted XRE-type DNA-binding protein
MGWRAAAGWGGGTLRCVNLIGLDRVAQYSRAHEPTGFAAADFSRVRRAKLQRFALERLISMVVKLNQDVEIGIEVKPRAQGHLAPA